MARPFNPMDTHKTKASILSGLLSAQKPSQLGKPGEGLLSAGKNLASNKSGAGQFVSGLLQGMGSSMNSDEAEQANRKMAEKQDPIIEDLKRQMTLVNETGAALKSKQEEMEKNQKAAVAAAQSGGGLISLVEYDDPITIQKNKATIIQDVIDAAGFEGVALPGDQDTSIMNAKIRPKDGSDTIQEVNIPTLLKTLSSQQGDSELSKALLAVADDIFKADPKSYQNRQLALRDKEIKNEEKRIKIAQDNAKIRGDKVGSDIDPGAQFDLAAARKQGQIVQEQRREALQKIHAAEDKIEDIDLLKSLLDSGDVITGNTLASKANRLLGELSGNKQLSQTQLYDVVAKSLYKVGIEEASFGNANQKEFQFLVDPLPDSKKTPEALSKMLDRFERISKRTLNRQKDIIAIAPDFSGKQKGTAQSSAVLPQSGSITLQDRNGKTQNVNISKLNPGQKKSIQQELLSGNFRRIQ